MKVPYIYIASPYSDTDEKVRNDRAYKAQLYTYIMFKRDVMVYSPIAHWHPIQEIFDMPQKGEAYWKQNEAMLSHARCLHVLQLPGWDTSVGVKTEIDYAKDNGIPIVYIDASDIL